MLFADKLTLDKPRRTSDGYLVVRAKAARTGVYQYAGTEVDPKNEHGLRDQALVNVLRDDETVFDKKAVHSFIGKPVTVDHPHEAVTADNWKDHASGVVMGALKDGEHLSFDLLLTDKTAITAVEDGKRELSNGYAAELVFGDFQAADGTACQAKQVSIRGNHVAIVDRGRAGSECAIADAARCTSLPADVFDLLTDQRTYSDANGSGNNGPARRETSNSGGSHVATKTITFDGLPLEVTDAAEAAITKLLTQLKDERDGRAADKTAHDKTLATKDAEIDDLRTKVVDQAKIDALADAKAAVVADAKQIAGDKLGETAGKSVAEVRRMACTAVLGDAALKDKSDEYVEARFDTLKDAKPGDGRDTVRDAISSGVRSTANDSGASVRDLARASQF
jgi:hypothetical protein